MSVAYTPGPWEARDYRADGKAGNAQAGSIWIDCRAYSKSGKTSYGGTVAEVYKNGTGSSDPAVQLANARLMAAAPDLLEALELLLNDYVRLAEESGCDLIGSSWDPEVARARAALAKARGQ